MATQQLEHTSTSTRQLSVWTPSDQSRPDSACQPEIQMCLLVRLSLGGVQREGFSVITGMQAFLFARVIVVNVIN
jgi:hypothetical protein